MYLTLPLPVHKKWRHTVYYVPWDSDVPHTRVRHIQSLLLNTQDLNSCWPQVPVEIGKDATFKDLRNLLGRWLRVNSDNV